MDHDTQRCTASSRYARLTTSLSAMIAVAICLAAGTAPTDAAGVREISIEVPAIEIEGNAPEPEVLWEPWIPKTIVPGLSEPWSADVSDSALDAQRSLVVKAKGAAAKRAQQIKLAAMLYIRSHQDHLSDLSKPLKDPEQAQLTEARRVLEDVVQHAGDNLLDEGVRRLLAACQFLLQDYPASEKTWQALLDENPNSKYRSYHRAWLAYTLLKQSRNQDALAAVGAETIDEDQPELAYVAAWARWRSHDGAGALKAIVMAVKHWQRFPCNSLGRLCLGVARNGSDDQLYREELSLVGRFDVPPSQVAIELELIGRGDSTAQVRHGRSRGFQDLGIASYGRAGRWTEGVATLDKAIEAGGDHVFRKDRVAIRSAQAEFAVRVDAPEAVAKYAAQAIDALATCGDSCDGQYKANALIRLQAIGRLFHKIYLTSNDPRYYQPTLDLYAMTMPLLGNAAARAQAEKEVALLGAAFKNASEGSGTHDKDVLVELLGLRDPEIQACYEASLASNHALAGSIALELDADAAGAMKGVRAQPVASVAELSAVASCVAEHARQWRIPRRGGAGSTHIKMNYTLTPTGSRE